MSGRAIQLDGIRAVAILAICWDHWCPATWPRVFPYEIFLFLFLVLTGYLITGSLLRERDRNEARGGPWRVSALKSYQLKRGLRILAPYYAALALAWIVRAPDVIGSGLPWYVFHLSNIHIADLGYWPSGTNHFWSLAIQQQFYLIWPWLIWFLPRKSLGFAILLFALIGPLSRMHESWFEPWFAWPRVLTWMCFDYFGIGGLFALAVHRGMSLGSPFLRGLAIASGIIYMVIMGGHALGFETYGLRSFQQTLLAIAWCGVIAMALVGFSGRTRRFLEHPQIQRIGQLSYGIYLFHNITPLLAGKLVSYLWDGSFEQGPGALLLMAIYAVLTWGLCVASWYWIELPLQGVRSRLMQR